MKGAEQGLAELCGWLEIPIVRWLFASVVPDPLGGIKFGPVGRQLKYLNVATVLGKPLIRFFLFMIGGIVLNQKHTVPAPIERRHQHLIQKRHVSLPLEIILLVEINKLGGVKRNAPKNLLSVALATVGNLRLLGHSCPMGMQGGRLAERAFALET